MTGHRLAPHADPTVRHTRTTRHLRAAVAIALVVVAASCGSDDSPEQTTPATTGASASSSTTSPPTTSTDDTHNSTAGTTAAPATTQPVATTEPPTPTTSVQTVQPAIWPASEVVFTTPEAAAADFVEQVLGVPPTLGEFRQGDSRSGEIEVFSPGEGSNPRTVPRGLLLMRQLGPSDGWFVMSAVSDGASIDSPESGATVPASTVTVTGAARGFEANINVTARVAGVATPFAEEITMGGSMETPEPFSVAVDLSPASPGDVVMVLVKGGVGLETDPGEFTAVPVVIT